MRSRELMWLHKYENEVWSQIRKHNLMLISVLTISSVRQLLPIIQVNVYANKHTDITQASDKFNVKIYITKGHLNAKRPVQLQMTQYDSDSSFTLLLRRVVVDDPAVRSFRLSES